VSDSKPAVGFTPSSDTPYLSNLLRKRKFDGDLGSLVAEAKKQEVFEDVWSPGEESEDAEQASDNASLAPNASVGARAPVVMRVPARTAMSPAGLAAAPRPASSKGRSPHLNFASLPPMSMLNGKDDERPGVVMVREDEDVDMDVVDLSPNTLVSNNAPSLVSDDGEYDDSDDGSSESEAEGSDDDGLDTESISDVAEINIDEEHEPPRPLRHHHRGTSGVGSGTAVRLRKDDTKHVTFVSPVKNSAAKERRARKV
jgi:ADA HAT complex component 1